MAEIRNWVARLGESAYFWVGARDLNSADDIVWTNTGEFVDVVFWMSDEPYHSQGDCVSLGVHGGLRMDDCQMFRPPLCQLVW